MHVFIRIKRLQLLRKLGLKICEHRNKYALKQRDEEDDDEGKYENVLSGRLCLLVFKKSHILKLYSKAWDPATNRLNAESSWISWSASTPTNKCPGHAEAGISSIQAA